SDLEQRLAGITNEDKKREEFQSWLREKLASDPALTIVRAEYIARGGAVPASLALGMIKLQRAAAAGGDERKNLLAQAEQSFLAIRDEAAGDPRFHLGLGQVYHRLGKTEEGEREMASVIERKDPEQTLNVAETYRSLGLYSRARQVARSVYDQKGIEDGYRYAAAYSLSLLALDLDEQEEWLKKGDPVSPVIRVGLDHVQGERLLRDGKPAEADQKFKKCVDFYALTAKVSSTAANNAATETLNRYVATGDPAHIKTAVSFFDDAVRMEPDEALILGNLISGLVQLAQVQVVGKWIDTRALQMEPSDLREILISLLEGPLASEAIEALRNDPSYQRALTLSKKHQVLAPQARGAYTTTLWWLGVTHDEKGLQELDRRLQMLPGSNDSDADVRERWLSGEQDERALRETKDDVARARRSVDRAKGASKATQAAAWTILAEAIESQLYFQQDAALMDEMVDAIHKARAAWPEGITRGEVSSKLFTAAFFRATSSSPSLKKALDDDRRIYGRYDIAYRAMSGPSAVEVTDALRKEPLLAESALIRKQNMLTEPTLSDFLVAHIAGDAELEQAASKVFDRRDTELVFSIQSRLAPNDKEAAYARALPRPREAPPVRRVRTHHFRVAAGAICYEGACAPLAGSSRSSRRSPSRSPSGAAGADLDLRRRRPPRRRLTSRRSRWCCSTTNRIRSTSLRPLFRRGSRSSRVVVLSPEDIQQRTFVRLVVQPGETLDQARARAKPWFDAIPLPPGDRLLYSTIEEENEITKKREGVGVRTFIGTSTVVLTHDDVGDAGMDAAPDPEGKPQVFATIQLNPNATERFRQFTKNNPLRRIAIMFDDNVIMSARIEGEITGGQLRISLDPETPFDARKAEIQEIVSALKPAKPAAVPSGTGGR
ncbi:MAG: hypothetical protein U0270_46370, partial [Labilithrix sp.]